MVVFAYILGFVNTHGWHMLIAAAVVFVLWGTCANENRPPGVRVFRFPLAALLIATVAALGFHAFDMNSRSDGQTGELIAAHGEPAKIELVTKTGSSRTVGRRRSASINYDVVFRYADGTTQTRNVDILDIPATKEGWRVVVESKVYEARCLPRLREACSIVGKAA